MLGYVLVTSIVTYNFGQDDIQRVWPQTKVALPETKSWVWRRRCPRQFKFLVFNAAKVPMHVRWTCLEKIKTRKKVLKNQACFRTCVDFFLKKKKLEKKTIYVQRTRVDFFFKFLFFFEKKIFHKSPMNMVGYLFHQKKPSLWNMRGSLPLLS